MKTAIFASVALLSLTAPALAATTDQYSFKGESASAGFYQNDGCSYTSVSVYAFDNATKNAPGAPVEQKEASLYYSNYNYCTGTGSYGYGSSKDITFTAKNSLQSASLTGNFIVYDYLTGAFRNATVDLNWTGTGDISRGNSHSISQGPGYLSKYRSVGAYRDASVTGSVVLDGVNLTTNLSSYGYLNSSNNGSLFITKQ
ncbi:MAG TPA: hypothetical protein VK203_14640 [Nostocaceae cyanobacterium]|nr:hypothetical protein [Nostocaceae cyanobacterium]